MDVAAERIEMRIRPGRDVGPGGGKRCASSVFLLNCAETPRRCDAPSWRFGGVPPKMVTLSARYPNSKLRSPESGSHHQLGTDAAVCEAVHELAAAEITKLTLAEVDFGRDEEERHAVEWDVAQARGIVVYPPKLRGNDQNRRRVKELADPELGQRDEVIVGSYRMLAPRIPAGNSRTR